MRDVEDIVNEVGTGDWRIVASHQWLGTPPPRPQYKDVLQYTPI